MADYSKPGPVSFSYAGMCTSCSPDSMPQVTGPGGIAQASGKVPLAINVHAYLDNAITPRLPQSAPLVTLVPAATIHSLRRMNDNTASIISTAFGPQPTGTGTDVTVPGGAVWSNPGNITAPDSVYATVSVPGAGGSTSAGPSNPSTVNQTAIAQDQNWASLNGVITGSGAVCSAIARYVHVGGGILAYSLTSQQILASGYGFIIPANATITGIGVAITRACNTLPNAITDTTVELLKNGSPAGSNLAAGSFWPTVQTAANYGGAGVLWGTTWAPSDINGAGFGVALSCGGSSSSSPFAADVTGITITVYYTVPSGATVSDQLEATNFGFSIPGGYTIAGIVVEVLGFGSTAGGFPLSVQMLKAGTLVGGNKRYSLPITTEAYVAGGNASDLWGTTWAPADINNTNFGVALQVTQPYSASIDFVRITVYAYSSSPATGYVLISGSADKVFVNSTQVASGMSQNRLAMVPFRPNNSVRPWMYIGDSNQMIKVSSDGTEYKTGIKEPQAVPTMATSGAGPLTGTIFYAYSYRSSVTGAQSNLSPISPTAGANSIVASSNNIQVTCTASTDPQVDLVDVWRFDAGLLAYTYVGTVGNGSPVFVDSLSDPIVANNATAVFSNFEPFPSIDTPKVGTLVVSAGPYPAAGTITCTWASGPQFNVRWLPGTIVTLETGSGSTQVTLFARPTSATVFVALIQPPGGTLANGTYTFSIPAPQLAAQPLPALWGPTDNAAYMFACGDPLRPGTLYYTQGNSPDTASGTGSLEMTSPSEPLIGGAIVSGLGLVMSTERGWLIYPNFSQATATAAGVVGSPFTTVETITERGLWAKEGICTDGGGNVYFVAKDGIRQSPGGAGSNSISDDISNLFPHEGRAQLPYTIGGYTLSPPDMTQPNGMCLRFSQGYVYFDYIGLDGAAHTLKYHVAKSAWSVDVYASVATVHADNEGQGTVGSPALPALGVLMGGSDATIRQLSSVATETATVVILTPSIGGAARATKHFGDLYVEYSVPDDSTPWSMALWTNRYSLNPASVLSPATLPNPIINRAGQVVELSSGSGVYAQDIGIAFSAPLIAPGLSLDGVTQVYLALYFWEPTLIEQPETIGERVTDWLDGGYAGAKLIQGMIVHADTGNLLKTFKVQSSDDLSINSLAEMPATGLAFATEQSKAFSFAQPFIAHRVRLVPGDTVPWRLWDIEWIFVPYPETAQEWHTPGTAHGLLGWQHVREMNIEYIATAAITVTIITDTGFLVTLTLPPSSVQTKLLVTVPPLKGKLFTYNFSSPSPFRLWKEDLEVKAGAWNRDDVYAIVKPFGGQSQTAAEV